MLLQPTWASPQSETVWEISTFNFLSLASHSRYYLYVEKNKHKKDYQQITSILNSNYNSLISAYRHIRIHALSEKKIRGNEYSILITIFLLAVIIVTLPTTMTTATSTSRVYGQQPDSMDLNITDSSANIQNVTVKKVQVGDIEIAYKMLGKGDPILLISPAQADMNAWVPSTLGIFPQITQ